LEEENDKGCRFLDCLGAKMHKGEREGDERKAITKERKWTENSTGRERKGNERKAA